MFFKNFKNAMRSLLKAHVSYQAESLVNRELARLQPFVLRLLDQTDPETISSPLDYMNLAFDLFQTIPNTVVKVKWSEGASEDPVQRRFERLLEEFRAGNSAMSAQHASEILNVFNTFIGSNQAHTKSATNVGWHFRISSSFGGKGRLLYSTVRFFQPNEILEIGTAYGMSAMFMMLASNSQTVPGHLWSIEANEPQFSLSQDLLKGRFGDRVDVYNGFSHDGIPAICQSESKFGMVFHDGGHSREDYVRDFENMLGNLEVGCIVIFDDIRWDDRRVVSKDPECYKGWREIVSHSKVRLAVEVNDNMGVALIGA